MCNTATACKVIYFYSKSSGPTHFCKTRTQQEIEVEGIHTFGTICKDVILVQGSNI